MSRWLRGSSAEIEGGQQQLLQVPECARAKERWGAGRAHLAMSLCSSCLCCWSSVAMACWACCCMVWTKCCMCWKASICSRTKAQRATWHVAQPVRGPKPALSKKENPEVQGEDPTGQRTGHAAWRELGYSRTFIIYSHFSFPCQL